MRTTFNKENVIIETKCDNISSSYSICCKNYQPGLGSMKPISEHIFDTFQILFNDNGTVIVKGQTSLPFEGNLIEEESFLTFNNVVKIKIKGSYE